MIYGEKKNERTARLAKMKEVELKGIGVWIYLIISCLAFASLLYIAVRDYYEHPTILLIFVWPFVPYVVGSIVGVATYATSRIAGPLFAYLLLAANWSLFFYGYLQGPTLFIIVGQIVMPFIHGVGVIFIAFVFGVIEKDGLEMPSRDSDS